MYNKYIDNLVFSNIFEKQFYQVKQNGLLGKGEVVLFWINFEREGWI